jgi:hypothetical protein
MTFWVLRRSTVEWSIIASSPSALLATPPGESVAEGGEEPSVARAPGLNSKRGYRSTQPSKSEISKKTYPRLAHGSYVL